jgi:hypothetical protein
MVLNGHALRFRDSIIIPAEQPGTGEQVILLAVIMILKPGNKKNDLIRIISN